MDAILLHVIVDFSKKFKQELKALAEAFVKDFPNFIIIEGYCLVILCRHPSKIFKGNSFTMPDQGFFLIE